MKDDILGEDFMGKKIKWSLLIFIAVLIALRATWEIRKNYLVKRSESYTLFIGGYGETAYKYSFNTVNHEFTKQGEYKIKNPSYLALSGDSKYLYAVSENGKNSAVGSFLTSTGELLSEARGSGRGPCYLSLYKSHLFVANYDDGSLTLFKTDTSGKITKALQQLKFVSASVIGGRDISHIHTARVVKGKRSKNDYLVITDLGGDKIYFYRIQKDTVNEMVSGFYESNDLKLYPCDSAYVTLPNGYGPRHLDFSKDGKYMFLLNEKSGHIVSYAINEIDNNLVVKVIEDIPADLYHGEASSDLHIGATGEFLYTSHRRGKDGIAIFRLDEDKGRLQRVAYQVTSSYPRTFTISVDGEYLFVACQKAKRIEVYRVNQRTGFLTNTMATLNFSDLEPSVVLVK